MCVCTSIILTKRVGGGGELGYPKNPTQISVKIMKVVYNTRVLAHVRPKKLDKKI